MAPPSKQASSRDLRHRVLTCLNRLSDRDTLSLAASELESIIPTLTPATFSLFISSVSSTSTADRSAVRVASLRLLSSLVSAHRADLSPQLSKLVSAVVRRFRDPDSSVRSACSTTSSSLAANVATGPTLLSAVLRPFSEALSTEQEASAQSAAAMCLSAAIEAAAPEAEPAQIGKMLPKWTKLLKCDSFKAKASLLALIRCVIRVCEIGNSNLLKDMVGAFVGFLKSEDWAARKAAAEALTELAAVERNSLSEFKASCLKTFESRRFDKVKAVREAMNLMVEAWKDIPDVLDNESPPPCSQDSSRENASNGRYPPRTTRSHISSLVDTNTQSNRKRGTPLRSSPTDGTLKTTARSKATLVDSRRRLGPPALRKLAFNKPSDGSPVVSGLHASTVAPVWEKSQVVGGEEEEKARFSVQGEMCKSDSVLNGALRIEDDGYQTATAVIIGNNATNQCRHHKECEDFSSIRKQLVQIETQQSSLMELLQKFIGSSQDGMHSLEARVNGLELALDDMSYDLAVSTTRMANSETPKHSCCLLPSTDFLSPKFWRRSETRYSATRFSLPSNKATTSLSTISNNSTAFKNPSTSTATNNTLKFENKKRFSRHIGASGFIINPLAETHRANLRGTSEISSNGVSRSAYSAA